LRPVKIGLVDSLNGEGCTIVRPGQENKGREEFFWITDLKQGSSGFTGLIDNDPKTVRCVHGGDMLLHFVKDDIVDWMYVQEGKIKGNATACPALAHATETERKKMADLYGIVCD
jgi:uncharacterized protein YegJ (DUF2314 family)